MSRKLARSEGFEPQTPRFVVWVLGVREVPTRPGDGMQGEWQGSLPADRLAFTGRELNPLDRYKRFQITCSFSSSGFILAQEGPSFISRTVTQRRVDGR